MKRKVIVFSDRYSALGIPRPNPKTACKGKCEGVGWYPTKDKRDWPKGAKVDSTGYVFVKCKICGGTGRIKGAGSVWKGVADHKKSLEEK